MQRETREGNLDLGVREGFSEEVTFRLKDEWARLRVGGWKGEGWVGVEGNSKRISLKRSSIFDD